MPVSKRKLSNVLRESAQIPDIDTDVDANCLIWRGLESVNKTKNCDLPEVRYLELTDAITFLALAKIKLQKEIDE